MLPCIYAVPSYTIRSLGSRFAQQVLPRTPQRSLNPYDGRHQDVCVARFDFLDRSRVQLRRFSELFLGDAPAQPFTADVGAKAFELGRLLRI